MRPRITQRIDENRLAVLQGHTHPQARPQFDQGPVDPAFKLERISLMFRPTAEQQAALDSLLLQQQDSSSPSFHKWLTPEEYAGRFGVSQSDLDKVVAWLQAQGFAVVETARSRNWVVFTGTAAQVQSALHTEIHHYSLNGQAYFANAGEPAVPSALASMVLGFRGLNNFPVKPRGLKSREANIPAQPNFTSNISGSHFLAPDDFATIYDLKPLYSGGIDGTGQTIGIMGQTNIVQSDIATFRSRSGLPPNAPQLVLAGSTDPGVIDGDVQEASLDIEWSGAVAPKATIIYVYSTNAFGSLQYAIGHNIAPVLSISYGACENFFTAAEISSLVSLTQQANAQGITIVAASGDGGAADCDGNPNTNPAVQGLTVDVPASLPYVTGIGGTEFNEGNCICWNATNDPKTNGSALSYIPETTWNDTSSANGLAAGGGGASKLFTKPVWQTGTGVPNDNVRHVPDISVNASPAHDGYLVCTQVHPSTGAPLTSGCQNGFRISATNTNLTVYGGTSFGAPAFAGIVALINQKTNSTGQGNVNFILYPLAASAPSAFHDISTGNNSVPCSPNTPDCPPNGGPIGFSAGTGYDMATGLGTFDATNMVNSWSSVQVSSGSTPTLNSISPTSAAAGSADFTLTANGSNFAANAQILWNGSALGVTMLPGGTTTTITATVSHTLVAYGTVASVNVTNQSPTAGESASQTLTVTGARPPNDNFANAIAVSGQGTSTVDNSGATTETTDPTPPCAGNSTNPRTKTVWWSLTPLVSGSITVDTIGSTYDTTLSVWTGTAGNLTSVGCNDDIVPGVQTQSKLSFSAAAGTKYYFMVAPFGPPDPAGDQFGGKTVLNLSGAATSSSLSASPTRQTVAAGASATFQVTNASSLTFSLTCSGLPTGASCGAVSVGGNTSASLMISTTSRLAALPSVPLKRRPPFSGRRPGMLIALLALSALSLLAARWRRASALIPASALLLLLAMGVSGCSGSSSGSGGISNPNGTPAGTYTITVNGTSGSTTQSTTVTLQVN